MQNESTNTQSPLSLSKPNSLLVWAILSTIFCCLPFGIVSIINASKVDGLWAAGDYEGAISAAKRARLWLLLSSIIGFAVQAIYVICYAVFFAVEMGGLF